MVIKIFDGKSFTGRASLKTLLSSEDFLLCKGDDGNILPYNKKDIKCIMPENIEEIEFLVKLEKFLEAESIILFFKKSFIANYFCFEKEAKSGSYPSTILASLIDENMQLDNSIAEYHLRFMFAEFISKLVLSSEKLKDKSYFIETHEDIEGIQTFYLFIKDKSFKFENLIMLTNYLLQLTKLKEQIKE